MNTTTYVKVVISTSINPTDRIILGNFLARAFSALDYPNDTENSCFTGSVSHEGFSALCILEDMDILTVTQLGD